ncbi:proteinase inhibitor I4 serpin [Oleispira antarctica]|uniref:Proteinase inhibitor I4 serpin n=1 Tax=Oleispira antarctica TaxID=188908 RepID=A0A1Y5HA81_OLEAN|nr:proteinase inhibitor I4 serpin [Oleispira antarctica]
MKRLLLIISVYFLSPISLLWADNMKAFPPAEEGQVRYVIPLAEKTDEAAFKVELVIGKTIKVDSENRYFFAGQIQTQNIPGWGFTRYVLDDLGPVAGTLMAVSDQAEKVERFIPLLGEPYLVRYNSRLPIVVYAPEDAEVHYRIWSAGDELHEVDPS